MVFDRIEDLKRDYTDKYVVVDESRPELTRFKGSVGRVKTVNMSGRALVEFNVYDNIGWYDIDLDFLKVVDAPPPPAPDKKAEKPAKESPKAEAATKPAAKPAVAAPSGAAKTTAEILAAARTKKGEAAPAAAAAKPAAPTKPAAAAAPAGKLSVAEILAKARGGGAAAPAPPAPQPEPAAEASVVEEAAEEAPAEAAPKPAKAAASGDRPKPGELSVDQIVAWCRQHDAK